MALDACAKSQDGGLVLLPNKKAVSNTEASSTGRGALSEPVIPAEDGSVYLSYPLVLENATASSSHASHSWPSRGAARRRLSPATWVRLSHQSMNFHIFTNYDCKKDDEGVADTLPGAWETIRREAWSNYTLYRSPAGVIFRSLESALAAAAAAKTLTTTSLSPLGEDKFVISNLVFKNITATGTHEQGDFFCSKDVPCDDVTMSRVDSDKGGMQCNYADGNAMGNSPAITCL